MNSTYDFLVTPLSERYQNTKKIGEVEVIINANIENFKSVSKLGKVISTPLILESDIKAGDIEKLISEVDNKLIKKVLIFDVFEGGNMPEGKKSLAVNVIIQSMDKTLSEKDIGEVSQKIIDIVKAKVGGTIRS